MIKKYLLITLAAFLLAACGGSDDKPLFNNSGSDTEEGGVTSPEDENNDVSTGTEILNPRLGAGAEASFEAGTLELSLTNLSAGGTAKISANIVDKDNNNKKIVSQSYKVVFSSTCSETQPAKAEFNNSEVTSGSGSVSVNYTAKGCVGEDTISANLFAGDALKHTAVAKITITPAEVGAINFVETNAPALAIKTMANPVLPTNTTVTFQVVDINGDPIIDKRVEFALHNASGGVSLAKSESNTDAAGLVSTIINSGTTHTSFVVNATTLATDGTTKISTSSQPIAVTTGLPRQDRFSISASEFNPASYNVDGVEVTITVRASDAFGNFPPAGTIVNLTAESGGIDSTCALDAKGSCSATWISSGARPGEYDASLNMPNDQIGMTTILAYTLGEAGFTDGNANYVFDTNEFFVTYPEPFRDDSWTASHSAGEYFHDTNSDGSYSAAPTVYQGSLCSEAAKVAGHCESLMHVRDQLRIVQTFDGSPVVRIFDCSGGACNPYTGSLDSANGGEFYVVLQDQNENMAPAGTTLTVNGDGYTIRGDDGAVNNNIGLLDGTGYARGLTGLPEFGMLYRVEYEPDTDMKAIELEANNGGKLTRVTLK